MSGYIFLSDPLQESSLSNIVPRILVADDELLTRKVLRTLLNARGYATYEAGSGGELLQAASTLRPDVILLDLGLPDIDGVEIIRRVREFARTPIIVLSVRATASDKTAAIDAGADDYLTKPYQPTELCEHVRAAVARNSFQERTVWVAGDLAVDLQREIVQVKDSKVELTEKEYNLLRILVINAGRLLTQQRLATELWKERNKDAGLQALRMTMASLRAKVEADPSRPRHIVTEPGVGYRLRTSP